MQCLRHQIITGPILLLKNTKVVLSGIADGKTRCYCITTSEVGIPIPELESNIEEADVRLIPHSLRAATDMANCVQKNQIQQFSLDLNIKC